MLVEQLLLEHSYDKSLDFTWDLYHNYGFNVKLNNTKKASLNTDEKIYLDKATLALPSRISSFPKPKDITKTFSNKRFKGFPTKQQEILMNQMQSVPLYVVVNGYNEVVSSSPRKEPMKKVMHHIYDSYFNLNQWESDQGPVSVNLFFVSKVDAEEYLNNIYLEKTEQVKGLGLGIYSVGLDYVYQLNKTSKPRTQYHIIPNLKELENASNNRMKAFQGTPVYVVNHLNNSNSGKVIFFSEKEAHNELRQLKRKFKEQKFQLQMSSLEKVLQGLERENVSTIKNTYFKTSEESTKHLDDLKKTQSTLQQKYMNDLRNHINIKVLVIKNFTSDLLLAVTKGGALINQ